MRQGARPTRHQSWTGTPQHEDPQEQELEEQRVQRQRQTAEILSRRPGVPEQHVRDAAGEAGLAGSSWWPSPVTSPDSARATEPRRLEATLELRRGARGARFGRGAGERERVRVRGEGALRDAERSREAATS